MSVSRDEVLHIAQLAELDVEDDQLPEIASQMSRILDYVAQLSAMPSNGTVKTFVPGPDAIRFRADEVAPPPLAAGPNQFAPAFKEGFFVVPKLAQFE
jgi:aspartyl-tRNA(Asn)/glutamyl-tRNA(Gln) amidotransferase subunit C